MATKLVIVESPTKAHKIGDYLGKGYTVMASVGHIRDLAQPSQVPAADKAKFGKFGVDVNDGFKPYYIVDGDKKRTVSELKSALKNADELYLATDEDREGEAIAWHLVQTLKPEVPVKRMVFHEITKNAINASLNNTRDVDGNMVDAQETRRILDRLYGYELSPVLWRKVGPGLSAGRVQSVATRLIVERERERMAFKRAPYWDIVATLSAPDALGERAEFSARMITLGGKRLAGSKDFGADGQLTPDGFAANVRQLDEAGATAVASALKTADFTVMSMETKPYRRRPQPPFTTSTLQQTAGNRLGMGARAVMRAAQSLYENGYITYMRTDSVTLSQEGITAARNAGPALMGDEVGTAFAPVKQRGSARRLWIKFAAHPRGVLVADSGAAKAVRGGRASLLAAGVLESRGDFAAGDPVWIDDEAGNHLARGLAGYDSEEIPNMLGRNTAQLRRLLGEEYAHPLVHRDNLVLV